MGQKNNKALERDKISDTDQYEKIKILLFGLSGVGKTWFAERFCNGKLPKLSYVTLGSTFYLKKLNINSRKFKLFIIDTYGSERDTYLDLYKVFII